MNEPRELKFRPKPTVIADGERSQEAIVNTESNTSVVDTITVKEVKEFIKQQGNESDAKFAGLSSNNTFTGQNTFTKDVAISGNLNVQGEGKGKISANEIVENMVGYGYYQPTIENLTKDFDYAGVVKNGNKLSMVLVGRITRTGSIGNDTTLAEIYIPQEVSSKIYPSKIGNTTNLLDAKVINFFRKNYESTPVHINLKKSGSSIAMIVAIGNQELTQDIEYYFRIEVTFLLSDSLLR